MKNNQHSDEDVRNGDKVKVYKWKSTGTRPELQWIHKDKLQVDLTYQRDTIDHRVLAIARDFWWMAFGAMLVFVRADGSYVVVDGGHRLAAVRKRSDIKEVPCLVFASNGIEEEADAFIKANTNRKPVRSSEMFRARLVAREPRALVVDELVQSIGRHVASESGSKAVACITALFRCVDQNEGAIRRIWPLVGEICNGALIANELVQGLHYIECSMKGEGSLASEPWASRIRQIGASGLVTAGRRNSFREGKGGARIWAIGMANELNKGMRTNRLLQD